MTDAANPPEPRTVNLREFEFTAKPTMSAPDFGLISRFAGGNLEGDYFELLNTAIRNTLVPESREAWDDLWEQDLAVPVTFEEVAEFANKLAEKEAGRPTQQPSRSGTTERSTATKSTDGSLSPEAKASLASVPAQG
jgi:hypothetical protein